MTNKKKIIIIDDEKDFCLLIKANLEDRGYDVVVLTKTQDAEIYIKQEHPDLIILDLVMPYRRGDEIIINLKKDNATAHIPIIMSSGKGEMVYNKKAQSFRWLPNTDLVFDRGDISDEKSSEKLSEIYHVEDYISKPYPIDAIIEKMEAIFEAKAAAKNKEKNNSP